MKQEYLDYFRKHLSDRLVELLGHAYDTVSCMIAQNEKFPDPSDRATLEVDRNFELRIRSRERKLIGKIKDAIERIDKGTFGICDECGNYISFKRLSVRPVTTQCINCKTKEEAFEKALGI